MKKHFYFLLALVMGAVFASCSKDDDPTPDPGVGSVYLFCASVDVDSTSNAEAANAQKEAVKKALHEIGFSDDNLTMELSGADSASVSKILLGKMEQVEEAVKANLKVGIIIVGVKGAEKKNFQLGNDKKHPVRQWYFKEFNSGKTGGMLNDVGPGIYSDWNSYRWVKWIRSVETYFAPFDIETGEYFVQFGFDTNWDAGGDYIHLYLEHSGKAEWDKAFSESAKHQFEWESQYASTYITDVIGIYGGGEPKSIVIDGRTYKKQGQVADLNKKATGEYIWLYATTDPVRGYEGYYLNTGRCKGEHGADGLSCFMASSKKDFSMQSKVKDPWVYKGHRIVQRVVQAYDTKGNHKGELNTNYSLTSDGARFIHVIMCYASKSASY